MGHKSGLWRFETRSPAQKSACKDLSRNGQERAITPEATYTPVSKRAGSRSPYRKGAGYVSFVDRFDCTGFGWSRFMGLAVGTADYGDAIDNA